MIFVKTKRRKILKRLRRVAFVGWDRNTQKQYKKIDVSAHADIIHQKPKVLKKPMKRNSFIQPDKKNS